MYQRLLHPHSASEPIFFVYTPRFSALFNSSRYINMPIFDRRFSITACYGHVKEILCIMLRHGLQRRSYNKTTIHNSLHPISQPSLVCHHVWNSSSSFFPNTWDSKGGQLHNRVNCIIKDREGCLAILVERRMSPLEEPPTCSICLSSGTSWKPHVTHRTVLLIPIFDYRCFWIC